MSLNSLPPSAIPQFECSAWVPAMAAAQTIGPAQTAVDANPGKVSLVATYDFTNAYMFRGLLQNDLHMTPDGPETGLWMFPFAEGRFDLHDDDDGVTDVALRIGTWNGLSTGGAGTAGPSGKLWYESRFYSAVDVTFGSGVTVGGGYTAYPSPNNSFSTVKELQFRVAGDERSAPAGPVVRPHALRGFAFYTD